MVENYHTDLMDEPINIPEVLKDGGRVILKEGGSIHDIYANTFLKKDHLGYVEVKSDGTFGMEKGEPVYLGKTSPDFNLGWSNMLTYKGFGLGFQINGRFGGVVTSSTAVSYTHLHIQNLLFLLSLIQTELILVEDILEMGLELTLQKEKQLLPM